MKLFRRLKTLKLPLSLCGNAVSVCTLLSHKDNMTLTNLKAFWINNGSNDYMLSEKGNKPTENHHPTLFSLKKAPWVSLTLRMNIPDSWVESLSLLTLVLLKLQYNPFNYMSNRHSYHWEHWGHVLIFYKTK